MATPLYPVNSAITGINAGLFPFEVNQAFFKEWVQKTPFYNFMSTNMESPIVRRKMQKGDGFQYRVGKLNAIDYTSPVYNFDQVSGSGQYQKFDYDSVTCRGVSFDIPVKNPQLLALGTPLNIMESIRPQLIDACQLNFNKSLLDAAMFDYKDATNVGGLGGYAPATQLASFDRVCLAGPTANLTARATYNGYAGLTTAWNDLATGVTYAQNGLSAKHLLKLKAMAGQGGNRQGAVIQNGRIEDAIRPAAIKSKMGFPMNEYIYLCNTASIQALSEDPMFNQSTINRGVIVDPSRQPETIHGADYYGSFYGIHIYEVRDLANYISTSQDGNKQIGWELFIGAGAWSAGWFEEPTIVYEESKVDRTMEFASHETRGEKALKFPAKQASTIAVVAKVSGIEQGIIHSFVRLG